MPVDFDHVFSYHNPTPEKVVIYQKLRSKARELGELIEELVPPGADCSASIRLLRECVFTANSGIALDGRISKIED